MTNTLFLNEEHELLRDQIRRFVAEEIQPHADAWEQSGSVPRDVLTKMGSLGFFGIRYPEDYGGSAMDTRATAIWAEELGRSTYSGVAITALVHTDMASVHLYNAGSDAQRAEHMPGIIAGEKITAVAITEPEAGALLHGASAAHNLPLPIDIAQAPASNSGRPSSVILFRMCTPILTSVF